ncbi:MAG: insulinase family protein, partial [Gammaproteobacteria bacterium]
RITVHAPAEVPYLIMGWKAPHLDPKRIDDWEPYALEVLASILAGGENSRLQKHLVRGRELASSADADYSAFSLHDGLFVIDAVPADGTDMSTLEQALLEQVARLKREPVAGEELERIKAGVVASEIYQRDSVQHQAIVLGMLAALGYPPQLMDDYADRIRAVTAEQVQAVARKYLVDRHRTVATLAPEPIDPAHPPSHFSGELR